MLEDNRKTLEDATDVYIEEIESASNLLTSFLRLKGDLGPRQRVTSTLGTDLQQKNIEQQRDVLMDLLDPRKERAENELQTILEVYNELYNFGDADILRFQPSKVMMSHLSRWKGLKNLAWGADGILVTDFFEDLPPNVALNI